MKKTIASFAFLIFTFITNAQSYPSVSNLKSNFNTVFNFIESDIKFIENTIGEKLTMDQRKNLENVFYNKYKHIAGSENLNNFNEIIESTTLRFKEVIGHKAFTKLTEKENAILILSGRIYLNPAGINN